MLVWPQIRRVTSLLRPLPKASRSADALVTLKHGETFTCVFENTRSWNRTLLSRFYVWRWTKCRLYCAELLCRAPTSGRNRNPACVLFLIFFFIFVQKVPDHRCCDGQCELAVWLLLKAISSAATLGEEEVQREATPAMIQGSIWHCRAPRFSVGEQRDTVTYRNYKIKVILVNYLKVWSLIYTFIHNCQ